MLESAWLFIGFIALSVTAVAVLTQTQGAALIPNDDGVAIVSGTVGFVSWAIWTYGTLDVEVVSDAGVEVFSMPSVTFFGIVMALIPAYVALTGPAEIIASRYKDPRAEDL